MGDAGSEPIFANAPAMREAVDVARRVGPARSTVLVTGETGTGKELVAALVHASSPRRGGPFVEVNCAAVPDTLLESELFGHERGAFTGAEQRRRGRFEQASGGTLLLDEIGELSLATQAKLLRVLQDQAFHRLGGTSLLRTDARIVAATNRDLEACVAEGAFRRDLYYRLAVVPIHVPPLRERPQDLMPLAEHFRARFAEELERDVRCFSPGAIDRLRSHAWPGNVRELRNAIERAVLLCEEPRIDAEDLSLERSGLREADAGFRLELPDGGVSLDAIERRAVQLALERAGYVQKDAAHLLGVSRRKLNYAVRRMGITHPTWRRNRSRSDGDT